MINGTFQTLNLQQRKVTTPLFTNARQAFMPSSQKYQAKYLVIDSCTRLPQKIFMQSNICPVFIYSDKSYIFQEGVSLHEYFLSRKESDVVLCQQQIWKVLEQVGRALILLRQSGYEHRHIKQYAIRKINDSYKLVFHPSINLPQQLIQQRTYNWYSFYLAPEQLQDFSHEESTTCVFSLGSMLLNIMNPLDFKRDIYSRTHFSINQRVFEEKLENASRFYSRKLMEVVKLMLALDYSQRLTLYELVNLVQKASPIGKKMEMASSLKHLVSSKLSKSKEKVASPPKSSLVYNDKKIGKGLKNNTLQINFQRGTFGGNRQDSSNQKEKKSAQMETNLSKQTLINSNSKNLYEKPHQIQTVEKNSKRSYSEYFQSSKSKQLNSKDKSMKQDIGKETSEQLSVSQAQGHIKVGKTLDQTERQLGYNQYFANTADKKKIKVGVSIQELEAEKYERGHALDTKFRQQGEREKQVVQQVPKSIQLQKKATLPKEGKSQLNKQSKKVEQTLKLFNSKIDSYHLKLQDCLQQPLLIARKLGYPGVWINGNVYYGEFKNGRRSGLALQIFQNKEYYYGYYNDDMFHGQGFYYWSAHQHFLGLFEAGGKKEGRWWGKRKYTGEIKENLRHGIGSYFYPNGKIYEGEWFMGKRHGSGIIVQPSGQKFVGTFKMGAKWGAGSYLLQGFRVNGVWHGQAPAGQVQIIYQNGRFYKGSINQDFEMHGKGELRFTNGSLCRGEFQFGDFVFGELLYENGERYLGQIKHYRRHGKGTYSYNDGREVTAEWDNNKNVRTLEN